MILIDILSIVSMTFDENLPKKNAWIPRFILLFSLLSFRVTFSRQVHLVLAAIGLLVIVTLFALLVGIIYMGSTSCSVFGGLTGMPQDICVTPGCLEVSAFLSKNMDSSVGPCDNFYKYACGGWMDEAGVPTDYSKLDVSSQLAIENERKWKEVIESPLLSSDDNSAEKKIKTFFKMCLHDYGRMKNGGRTLIEVLRHTVGEWYVFDPDNWQAEWNVDDAIVMAHKEYIIPVFFDYRVWPDYRNRKRNILTVINILGSGQNGRHF